jgi:hypothetical protein
VVITQLLPELLAVLVVERVLIQQIVVVLQLQAKVMPVEVQSITALTTHGVVVAVAVLEQLEQLEPHRNPAMAVLVFK